MSGSAVGSSGDLESLLRLAREVVAEAAGLVAERRRGRVEVADTKTSSVDVVTEVDRACEDLVRGRLAAARPDDGFLGEESSDETAGSTGIRWVLDPIDGTVNYLYGIPQYAVSLAAQRVEDGGAAASVVGVVADVAAGSTYWASLGGGAFCDDAPLSCRRPGDMAQWLVLTGFGYDRDLRRRQGEATARLLGEVRDIRRCGSCALDLCAVASGRADAYLEEGPQLWDHAAAALIAIEAGARVGLVPGASGRGLLLCAPAGRYDEFAALAEVCGFTASDPR